MYFVNRSEIVQTLVHMDNLLTEVKDTSRFHSAIEKLGLERLVHILIEAILDVGNMMIDGFIMRDPGSYHDIIDILVDELVIPEKDAASYKALIDLRQIIVQDYLTIDHDTIETVLLREKAVLSEFTTHIEAYLDNELGVANAFSNESKE